MTDRLGVTKTYKLAIDGKFPRSESGRSTAVHDGDGAVLAHVCRASRKDVRDAVEAARKAQPGWQGATASLRGQILYRIAEMMEGKRGELADAIDAVGRRDTKKSKARMKSKGLGARGSDEVALAIDRVVHYAGWTDKFSQVLGCNNAVAGPFYNFTIAEPTGVVAVVAPDERPLLALVSLLMPALCAGNTAVCLASEANPLPALVLAEALATGDLPAGVVNTLSGERAELLKVIATHRDIDAVHAANLPAEQSATLREGAAENLKRVVVRDVPDWADVACESPWWIEPLVEFKTVWHPSSV